MRETIIFLQDMFSQYWGNYGFQGWFFLAMFVILLLEKDSSRRKVYGIYSLIVILLILNPLTVYVMKFFFGEKDCMLYYFRLFSEIPMMCIMAYGFILLLKQVNGLKKFLMTLCFTGMILIGGNNIYQAIWMKPAVDSEKTPEDVRNLCQVIHSDEEIVKAAFPAELSSYVRQIDASIVMPYGRYVSHLGELLAEEEPDAVTIMREAKVAACDFIVIRNTQKVQAAFLENGWSPFYATNNYLLYHVNGVEGIEQHYNNKMQVVSLIYVNKDNQPMKSGNGYSEIRYEYDKYGRNIYENYYDEKGNSFQMENGYSGLLKEYDDKDRLARVFFLNDEKEIIETIDGYSEKEFLYNDENEVEDVNYYNLQGNLVDSRGNISVSDSDWIITNYADDSGHQGMFYTIYNKKSGGLIVVDSGWKENETQVRKVIENLGGHVDAWFITHYDSDHVDAFNEIYANAGEIDIEKIYVSPLDYDYYMSQLREWDTPASFERFLEVTNNSNNVIPLKRGDSFDILGLQIDVFNAYDDIVKKNGLDDIPNYASLVFKISGESDSILFCGDCHGEQMGNVLYKEYGEALEAEYVQLGHHGNNSFTTEFYDKVSPDVALFDAPYEIMVGEQYTAAELKEYFINKDVQCYDFSSDKKHFFYFR